MGTGMLNDASNVIAFGGNTMVYESIKRHALKELRDLIRVLMENVDDALFDLSEKVDNDRDRTMYFDAMRLVRLKRQAIESGFAEAMQRAFDDLMLERGSSPQPAVDGELELSLVAHEEIEDQLAIEGMISRARPRFEDELYALRERLRTVLHRKEVDPDQNPFDPKAISESFHDACSVLDTEIEVKLILYKLFDRFVMRRLDDFYRKINDDFVQKGVLPELQADRERLNDSTRRVVRYPRDGAADNTADAASGEEAAAMNEGNVLALLQQALMPGAGGTPVAGAAVAPGAGDAGTVAMPGAAGSGQLPGFINALGGLQNAPAITVPLEQTSPEEMKARLQQQLGAFREQNRHQVGAAEDQIIDIVSMLFDFFFDDKSLPDPIKVLIGRLQIPILKVAILDRTFFNSKKHPARRLLDSISKASLGWSEDKEQEQRLIQEIERVVNFLINEFDQDIVVFEQALQQFEGFLEQERRRVAGQLQRVQQQEQEQEARLREAGEAADGLLARLLEGRLISDDVQAFLRGIWRQVLVTTWLAEGEDSRHWNNLSRITGTLIWTLVPKDSTEQRKKLLATLPPLLRALAKGMQLIQVGVEERNRVFQMLMLEHARVTKQTSRNIVARASEQQTVPAPEAVHADAASGALAISDDEGPSLDEETTGNDALNAISGEETAVVIRHLDEFTRCVKQGRIEVDEEIVMASEPEVFTATADSEEIDAEWLERARNLQVGDWVEFLQDNGRWRHARLSWKSNVTGKMVFVNRHGRKLRDTRAKHLAREFSAGRARLIESVSVFDRAIHSILSGLKS